MALSMDEERMLAEIERRLADDDPVLAARLTSFRLPRLTLATRSARSRLTTSVLMLVVVGVVSVFVYALIPFRGQAARMGTARTVVSHSAPSSARQTTSASATASVPGFRAAPSGPVLSGPALSAGRPAEAQNVRPAGTAANRTPAQPDRPAPGRSAPSSAYGK